MDNLALMEIPETFEHAFGHLAKHLLSRPAISALDLLVDRLERSSLAVLHTDRNGGVLIFKKGAIVAHDVVAVTSPVK